MTGWAMALLVVSGVAYLADAATDTSPTTGLLVAPVPGCSSSSSPPAAGAAGAPEPPDSRRR